MACSSKSYTLFFYVHFILLQISIGLLRRAEGGLAKKECCIVLCPKEMLTFEKRHEQGFMLSRTFDKQ